MSHMPGPDYQTSYRRSLTDPEAFWAEAAQRLHWRRPWQQVVDRSEPPFYRWFTGGKFNTCENALDVHVDNGRGSEIALIYDSPVTKTHKSFTYAETLDDVAKLAGALLRLGVSKGDRVIIYMPMVPETVHAMLACARIGAIHSVVFGGFASRELSARIDDAAPKVLMTASCGIEVDRIVPYKPLVDEALELANEPPQTVVVLARPECEATMRAGRDVSWAEALENAEPARAVSLDATDPLYILYTSGTTGRPKGVVRDHAGHAVALDWSMRYVYDVEPGDVFWAASDVGWVVGHSYIVYAPLLHGCATVLYEGKPVGTPDPGAFWRVIRDHQVNVLFTAPTAFRAIKREDPDGEHIGDYDISSLRALFLAGERCDPDTLRWAESKLGIPVIDHWWQTETGWPMVAQCRGFESPPVKVGSPTKPVPGYDVRVVSDDGSALADGEMGNLVVKLPLPPGCLPTLWNDDAAFVEKYLSPFPGYYHTSDSGYRDEDGYFWIMSRTDDVINVAGHRLSTGAMEEVLSSHPDIAECAVLGVTDSLKGQIPLGLVVVHTQVKRDEETIASELIALVRELIGPVASFKRVILVHRLPKTRSGKILRATVRAMADGLPYEIPATIEDPAVIDELETRLSELGFPRPG